MFDHPTDRPLTLSGARIVTPDGLVEGALRIEAGRIAGIGRAQGEGIDLGGQFLIPGIVDIHTDHAERHVMPRLGVEWAHLPALMAHDGVVISGGTTTVFDSLSVGASMQKPERRVILLPLVSALEQGRAEGMFRADHLLHLRCEICDPATIGLVDALIGRDIARLVSVMDHTPGDRQSPDMERWLRHTMIEMEMDEAEGRAAMAELLARSARVGATVRAHVLAASAAHARPVMSHDDRTLAQVDEARAEGIAVSEFPCTLEAARACRAAGIAIVAGAPNYLRGGSQSGNVAVADLLAEGLVDILASDYVPRSPLDAAFAIAADPALPDIDLARALDMVAGAPARLTGLHDRGRIAPGLRADFTVLSADPLTANERTLATIRVELTVVGGTIAYDAGAGGSSASGSARR